MMTKMFQYFLELFKCHKLFFNLIFSLFSFVVDLNLKMTFKTFKLIYIVRSTWNESTLQPIDDVCLQKHLHPQSWCLPRHQEDQAKLNRVYLYLMMFLPLSMINSTMRTIKLHQIDNNVLCFTIARPLPYTVSIFKYFDKVLLSIKECQQLQHLCMIYTPN